MIDFFTTREIAIMIWLVIVLSIMLSKHRFRSSMLSLIKSIFKKQIVLSFVFLIIYLLVIFRFFYTSAIWDDVYLKTVILSSIFIGLPMYYKGALHSDPIDFISSKIKSYIKYILIVQYFVNTYTFNIIIELVVWPFLAVLAVLDGYVTLNEKYQDIKKIITSLNVMIGFVMIIYSFSILTSDYHNLVLEELFISILIPFVMIIILAVPTYLISLYTLYETAFIRLGFVENTKDKNNKIRRFKLLRTCNLDIRKIRKFSQKDVHKMYNTMTEDYFEEVLREL